MYNVHENVGVCYTWERIIHGKMWVSLFFLISSFDDIVDLDDKSWNGFYVYSYL